MNLACGKLQIEAKQFEAETQRHDDLQKLQAIMTQ